MRAGDDVRRIRLATGLVLLAYLVTHFLNHALGLISLEAMEAGRRWFLLLWRNPVGTVLLYGSLLLHFLLAFRALYGRRSLSMPGWELGQLVLGLMIPPLLAIHLLGTRLAHELYGTDDSYIYVVLALWVFDPWGGVRQTAALLVAWTHGCIGLHFWLRLKPWYPRARPYLFAAALLSPVLGLLGFADAGQALDRLAAEPGWLEAALAAIGPPEPAAAAFLYRLEGLLLRLFALLLGGTLLARLLRSWRNRHRAVPILYPDGRKVVVQPGSSVLEASRLAGIPHAAVCGGRGRCSTCRVRVAAGLERLPPPSEAERRVLERVGAAPNVRLACQTRPTAPLAVEPLLPPTATPRDAQPRPGYLQGHEEEIAILFADLRAFTRLAERKLPYDVVFLLNRYFRAMGTAVEESGGHLDKFIGDGVMALFGVGGRPERGCREALQAARRMAINLEEVNRTLADEIEEPLRIGIGIHVGPVIVGEMGYARATSVTAIGDAVNAASRLEALTKDYGCQLVLAEAVAAHAGLDLGAFERREIALRGRAGRIAIRLIPDARALPLEGAAPRRRAPAGA